MRFIAVLLAFISAILQAFDEESDVRHITAVPSEYRYTTPFYSHKPKGHDKYLSIKKRYFPILVAEAIKQKKHEWLVIAFVKKGNVIYSYAHKGQDSSSVHVLPAPMIAEVAKSNCADLVLMFHNHPNGIAQASEQDMRIAVEFGRTLVAHGISIQKYVCARGNFTLYFNLSAHKNGSTTSK